MKRFIPALFLSLCLTAGINSSIAATTTSTSATAAKFYVDGRQFEFLGAFIPGWYWGQRQSDQTDIALLESAREAGFTALHLMPPIIDAQFGVYKETEFRKLDSFLNHASRLGIRVIIPFIHNIAMTQPGYGPFYSPYGIETLIRDQDFKNAFVLHMRAMANRVNSISGLKYSEDPTILGWIIIEEPISGAHNYPERPPNVTHYEVRQWLDEMAIELKAVDPNHLVGVILTAAGEGAPEFEDRSLSILETPSLDFIEIEDGDVRVLQTERSNHFYDLAFGTGKPVIMFVGFTGLSYPDPGQSVPNEARMMAVCNDYQWQANTLFSEFSAYRGKGAAGFSFFSWRVPGQQAPDFDRCFSYSLDIPLVVQSFQQMNAFLGPLNAPGLGFTTTGYSIFISQSDCLLNWAERNHPDLFAPAGAISNTWAPYYYRYYAQTNAYLATSSADNHVYYLGPSSNNAIVDVGGLSTWLATASCQ